MNLLPVALCLATHNLIRIGSDMGELSRENFYAKTATAPRAVQGFFETVFEHFNKRNDICAYHPVPSCPATG